MGEPKPLASLSSGLLARKGQAKPAMRPQGFAGFGMGLGTGQHEDLGWNDMGFDPVGSPPEPISADIIPILPPTGDVPPVLHQQALIEQELTPERVAQVPLTPSKTVRAAPGSKGKAAFTLRLDPERHLKLRLVCAVNHVSAQQTVILALDAYLKSQPALADLGRSTATTRR